MALAKIDVVKALAASLRRDLESVEAAARAAHGAATHPEAKPENDKDTRALEAGYLAGAQSARAAELKLHLELVEKAPPAAFSLFTLRENDPRAGAQRRSAHEAKTEQVVLLSKWGGGQKLDVDGVSVSVITPQSPIGSAVAGLGAGDEAEVEMGPKKRLFTVVAVQ